MDTLILADRATMNLPSSFAYGTHRYLQYFDWCSSQNLGIVTPSWVFVFILHGVYFVFRTGQLSLPSPYVDAVMHTT